MTDQLPARAPPRRVTGEVVARRKSKKPEPITLRVTEDGRFEPASAYYAAECRRRKLRRGDLVHAVLTKPRNPKHHNLVMAALAKVLDNLDGLQTMDQLLTILKIKLGRVDTVVDASSGKVFYVPQSISFASMDQGAFAVFWTDLCRVLERDYLPGFTPAAIEELADMMEDA